MPEQCPRSYKHKAEGNDEVQDLKTKFNKEIELLRRTQTELKMKLKIQ